MLGSVTSTHKEERIESFVWCIEDYLNKLNDKVSFGKISANDISFVILRIKRLTALVAEFTLDCGSEDDISRWFMEEQEKLNEALK